MMWLGGGREISEENYTYYLLLKCFGGTFHFSAFRKRQSGKGVEVPLGRFIVITVRTCNNSSFKHQKSPIRRVAKVGH